MRILARHLLIPLLCTVCAPSLAWAEEATPNGVEMLRAALQDTDSEAARDRQIRLALPVLRQDAINGDAKAQYNLARLYETGVPSGTARTPVTFPARAYAWYVAAARQGHPMAKKRLAATGSLTASDKEAAQKAEAALPAPVPLEPNDKAAMSMDASYLLKIASFRNRDNAVALVEILTEEGVIVLSRHRKDADSGEWHIVETAPIFSRAEAETLAAGLKRNFGVDPQIKEISVPQSTGEPSASE